MNFGQVHISKRTVYSHKLTGHFNVRLVVGDRRVGDPKPVTLFPPPSLKSNLLCLVRRGRMVLGEKDSRRRWRPVNCINHT